MTEAQANVFHYADSLSQAKQYSLAALEYERIVYDGQSPSLMAEAAIKRAGCLKMEKEYGTAAATLDAINTATLTDSTRYRVLFGSALNSYLADEPAAAFSTLEKIGHFYPDSAGNRDVLLMKILSLNELRHWKQADTLYGKFMAAYDREGDHGPDPYRHIPRLKDPDKAQKLSAYLPFTGAGFFYAGNIGEGILNVALQTGLIAFGAYSVLMKRYITGILLGVGGYASFYKGGVRRVKWLVDKSNERKTLVFNGRVRSSLMKALK